MTVDKELEDLHLAAAVANRDAEPLHELVGTDPGVEVGARRAFGALTIASGVVATLIILLALVGPWLTPHTISEVVGLPFESPSPDARMGTDFLGRDVFSRVLAGGRSLIVLAFLATAAVTVIGVTAGIVAGFRKGFLGGLLMRLCDVLLILPPILILLVLAGGYGGSNAILVGALVLSTAPFVARVTRAATFQVVGRGFVEAAVARGERAWWVLGREVLPNITGVILAQAGLVFVGAVYLTAAASFLGISGQPPASDWGRMIQENMPGVELQPWGVAAPATVLVLLAVSVNLFADGMQRRFSGIGPVRRRAR